MNKTTVVLLLFGIVALSFVLVRKVCREGGCQDVIEFKEVSLQEFADAYLAKHLHLQVHISPAAQEIHQTRSIGFAHTYPLDKILLVASDSWGVKFYIDQNQIYIHAMPESVTHSDRVKIICAQPLPVHKNLRFSRTPYMCGPNCLALMAYALGNPVTVEHVARLAGTDDVNGTSLWGLCQAARQLGLKAAGVNLPLEKYIREYKSPIIIHTEEKGKGHYVILHCYNLDRTFTVIDPPETRIYSETELRHLYDGKALFVWQ